MNVARTVPHADVQESHLIENLEARMELRHSNHASLLQSGIGNLARNEEFIKGRGFSLVLRQHSFNPGGRHR